MRKQKAWRADPRAIWRAAHPWVRFVEWARRRCRDKNSVRWRVYREKGITCDLTCAQLAERWKLDKAHLLTRPSLDRFPDTNGNYTISNVRFIEFNLNSKLASEKRWDAARELKPDTPEADCYTDAQL